MKPELSSLSQKINKKFCYFGIDSLYKRGKVFKTRLCLSNNANITLSLLIVFIELKDCSLIE